MIYCYYDKNGVLREIINNESTRQGNASDKSIIKVYCEEQDFASMSVDYRVGDYTSITHISNTRAYETVPYNSKINYKYFKDNTPYTFFVFEIPDDILTKGAEDLRATNVSATFKGLYRDDTHLTLGLLTFNLQASVLNVDDTLTTSQMQYLIDELAKYDFIAKNGIVGTLENIVDGQTAPTSIANNMFVLWYGTKTSTYDTSKTIKGIRLFQNVNGKYKLYYSSFEDTEKVLNNESVNETQSLLLTNAINEIEHLKSLFLDFATKEELSQVAFTGNYNDLTNKPTIPTQVSELTNNLGFIANATEDLINYYKKSETFTKDEIIAKLNAIKTIKFEIYASLDDITNPQANVIYLIGTASPYKEYAYIEGVGFEIIGSTDIDLSNYVQSDDTLNTNKIVVGNGAKNIKTTDYNVRDYGTSGIMLNSDTDIPTSKLVLNEISKYHAFFTINGDSGNLGATTIASASDYKLIIDENLLVYRRISKQTGNIVYHSQEVIDGTHIRDYYLTFNSSGDYVRTFVENVSHAEFDDLVANTPTDIKYNTETKVAYLEHDGTQIGSGAVIDLNGYVPYYDGDTLVLSELEQFTGDVATKEYVDNNAGGVIIELTEDENISSEYLNKLEQCVLKYNGLLYYCVLYEEPDFEFQYIDTYNKVIKIIYVDRTDASWGFVEYKFTPEEQVNELIANYMTENYENGNTGSY